MAGIENIGKLSENSPFNLEPEDLDEIATKDLDIEASDDEFEDEYEEVEIEFYDNLAEYMEEEDLLKLAQDVIDAYESDTESRSAHDKTIADGLNLLGIKLEEGYEPFEGACTAAHPLIMESAVKFQARASAEIFPANGPVKTKVLGEVTEEKEDKARRVRDHMNYQLETEMDEYFDDMEIMLLYLPIIGSGFKKIYFDEHLGRPVAEFVPYEQFVAANRAVDLRRCPRYTQVLYKTEDDLIKDINADIYRDVLEEMGDPELPEMPEITEKIKDIIGVDYGCSEHDEVYTLLEQHVDVVLPEDIEKTNGEAVPCIVTVDLKSRQVLSLRRNWKYDDVKRQKRIWFTHYKFVPGFGFYGLGFIHLLGNFQMTLTAVMRSLVDSGQFANMQGGYKAKGLRIIGDNEPISPGEWREAEATGMDLSKAFFPLPYKEPSIVLLEMLKLMDARGQRFADTTEQTIADSTNYGPVGTTLALLEASTKFFSGVHKRLHKVQKKEFRIIADINSEFLPKRYPYDVVGGSREVFATDYDGGVDICPVSDPNISSSSHRLTLAQTRLDVASRFPNLVDTRSILKDFFKAMGQEEDIDKFLPPPEEAQQLDPVSDIAAAVNGKPIKAFVGQDHTAHIKVKERWLQDPMNGKNPLMQNSVPIIVANIREHMLLRYQETMQAAQQQGDNSEAAMAIAADKVAQVMAREAEALGEGDPLRMAARAQLLEAETGAKKALHDMQIDAIKVAIEAQKLAQTEQKEINRAQEAKQKLGKDILTEQLNRVNDITKMEMKEIQDIKLADLNSQNNQKRDD